MNDGHSDDPLSDHQDISKHYNATVTRDLDPALLSELTRALLPYLGPYSITTVKRASRITRDPDSAIVFMANQIEASDKRQQFIKSAERILLQYQQAAAIAAVAGLDARTNATTLPLTIIDKNTADEQETIAAAAEVAIAPRAAAPLTAELMSRGEAALAPIIGPLAGVLVQRYARITGNSREFFERLATHLRDDGERDQFFESVRTRNGLLKSTRPR